MAITMYRLLYELTESGFSPINGAAWEYDKSPDLERLTAYAGPVDLMPRLIGADHLRPIYDGQITSLEKAIGKQSFAIRIPRNP